MLSPQKLWAVMSSGELLSEEISQLSRYLPEDITSREFNELLQHPDDVRAFLYEQHMNELAYFEELQVIN